MLRLTEEQYQAYLRQQAPPRAPVPREAVRLMVPAYRSKTEARFALEVLEPWQRSGPSRAWWYEPLTLILAPGVRYTVDFMTVGGDKDDVTFYEVKGAWIRDRALVKPRLAAALFPHWQFYLAQWAKQAWEYRLLRSM